MSNFSQRFKRIFNKDVDAFFKGKKGIKRKVIETHDDVKQVDYWYVDPDGKKIGNSNTPVFYVEVLMQQN